VTISLEEPKALSVPVLGEVTKPGTYPLDADCTVLHALAAAGGLTEFAAKDRIFVVRTGPKPLRIRFTYGLLTQAQGHAASFRLRTGDVVVAE
jgi:polysaccharide export outer membrane protein